MAVYGIAFSWRWLAGLLGIRQCYLHEDGVIVTGLLGRVRDAVAWCDVAMVQEAGATGILTSFRRFEFRHRTGFRSTVIVLLSIHRTFARELIRLANEKIDVSRT
ncbi:hypothetical protein [Kitasatospora sp. NPDC085879]|uniref:hypothetical protein n=1 Tax=Kitasatospora sp. NPDC085879 TaxID=3154769 RepID=UPI00341F9794